VTKPFLLHHYQKAKSSVTDSLTKWITAIFIVGIAAIAYNLLISETKDEPGSPIEPSSPVMNPQITEPQNNYACEGKQYCTEMLSCEEARFYLENCPNVKIDGDNDGVPCETQWCNFRRGDD